MKNQLKLSDIRKPFKFSMNRNTCVWIYLNDILDEKYGYKLDFDVYLPSKKMNLQRPLCWNLHQKRELILSILKEIKIPSISVIQYSPYINNDDKIYKIIDGKQRLTTMIGFIKGEFSIIWDEQEFYFNDLDEDAQRTINLYSVIGDVAFEYYDDRISDDEIIRWFEVINFSGTPQDEKHLKKLKQ